MCAFGVVLNANSNSQVSCSELSIECTTFFPLSFARFSSPLPLTLLPFLSRYLSFSLTLFTNAGKKNEFDAAVVAVVAAAAVVATTAVAVAVTVATVAAVDEVDKQSCSGSSPFCSSFLPSQLTASSSTLAKQR